MDLRPSSEFVLLYTEETNYDKMIQDIFNPVDKLFPEDAHEFLINFFLEVCSPTCPFMCIKLIIYFISLTEIEWRPMGIETRKFDGSQLWANQFFKKVEEIDAGNATNIVSVWRMYLSL